MKGYVSGSCAQGFGGCCVLYLDTCGGTISNNRTYIRLVVFSYIFPKVNNSLQKSRILLHLPHAGACTWTLAKCATNICQMRLDFDVNSVSQPDSKGICNIDYFQVNLFHCHFIQQAFLVVRAPRPGQVEQLPKSAGKMPASICMWMLEPTVTPAQHLLLS